MWQRPSKLKPLPWTSRSPTYFSVCKKILQWKSKVFVFPSWQPQQGTRLNSSVYQYNMASAFQGPLPRDVCDTDLSVTAQRELLIQRAVRREGAPKLLPGLELFQLTASSYQKYWCVFSHNRCMQSYVIFFLHTSNIHFFKILLVLENER